MRCIRLMCGRVRKGCMPFAACGKNRIWSDKKRQKGKSNNTDQGLGNSFSVQDWTISGRMFYILEKCFQAGEIDSTLPEEIAGTGLCFRFVGAARSCRGSAAVRRDGYIPLFSEESIAFTGSYHGSMSG